MSFNVLNRLKITRKIICLNFWQGLDLTFRYIQGRVLLHIISVYFFMEMYFMFLYFQRLFHWWFNGQPILLSYWVTSRSLPCNIISWIRLIKTLFLCILNYVSVYCRNSKRRGKTELKPATTGRSSWRNLEQELRKLLKRSLVPNLRSLLQSSIKTAY